MAKKKTLIGSRSPAYLNALRAFEASARHGSFSGAAGELNVTAAAVGQLVRGLEDWLGLPLFYRSASGRSRLVPTEAAARALPDIKDGLDRLSLGLERLREATATGVLTVAVSPAFAAKWMLPRIHRFQTRWPDTDVRLDTGLKLIDYAAHGIDIGVRYGGGQWDGLTAEKLMDEEVFPVCSPAVRDGLNLREPADLTRHTLIHDLSVDPGIGFTTWETWLRSAGVAEAAVQRGLRINNSAAVLQAAAEGQGIALARSILARDDIASGRLVRLFRRHRSAFGARLLRGLPLGPRPTPEGRGIPTLALGRGGRRLTTRKRRRFSLSSRKKFPLVTRVLAAHNRSLTERELLMSNPILIVGGGLAGLTVARRLHQAGIPFRVLEARQRLGGRILSVDAAGDAATDGFDLGPSWYWPGTQPALNALVNELGLGAFPQNSEGDIIIHRMSREKPQRYHITTQQVPQSMRLAGGSGALIAALAADLPADSIRLAARVAHVTRNARGVAVRYMTASGSEETVQASHIVFALPPRLLEATVTFSPALDAATAERWRATPTWMAPHAKVFALYEKPFWREAGLSGTAQSMAGPLVEIHDATTVAGQPALFGFLGIPAERRAIVGEEVLIATSIQQLVRLFGPRAAWPSGTLFKDWAADPLTATQADQLDGGPPVATGWAWIDKVWRDCVSLACSETAQFERGYLAGAVDAAERAVADIVSKATAAQ